MFARMNLLSKEDVKVDYSVHLDRFSIIRNDEWLSISTTSFEVLHTLASTQFDFERVIIQQQGSEVEIIKLLSNYILTFKSKTVTTSLILTSNVMNTIKENFRHMMNIVRVERERRGSNMKVVKRKKMELVREGEGVVLRFRLLYNHKDSNLMSCRLQIHANVP